MKKPIIITLLICLLSISLFAQKKNSVYLEAAGNGIVYTVNYDRLIKLTEKLKLAPRIGFEYFPQDKNSNYSSVIVPVEINLLLAKRAESRNFFEGGIGVNFFGVKEILTINPDGQIGDYNNRVANFTTVRVGFRHQKPVGGFMYRAGLLVPITQDDYSMSRIGDDIFFRIYAGFSLGYTF